MNESEYGLYEKAMCCGMRRQCVAAPYFGFWHCANKVIQPTDCRLAGEADAPRATAGPPPLTHHRHSAERLVGHVEEASTPNSSMARLSQAADDVASHSL